MGGEVRAVEDGTVGARGEMLISAELVCDAALSGDCLRRQPIGFVGMSGAMSVMMRKSERCRSQPSRQTFDPGSVKMLEWRHSRTHE